MISIVTSAMDATSHYATAKEKPALQTRTGAGEDAVITSPHIEPHRVCSRLSMDAVTLRFFAGLLALIAVAGCERKSSVAIVLEKEYIPARGSIPPAPGPAMTAAPTTTPAQDSR